MANLVDLTLTASTFTVGSAIGTTLAQIEGVSPAIAESAPPEMDFSDPDNSQYLG